MNFSFATVYDKGVDRLQSRGRIDMLRRMNPLSFDFSKPCNCPKNAYSMYAVRPDVPELALVLAMQRPVALLKQTNALSLLHR